MGERVWLHHPETGGTFSAPAEAVGHYEERGWTRAAQADVVQAVATEGVEADRLDRLTVPALTELAAERGVTLPADAKKPDIVAALEAHAKARVQQQ